MDDIRLFFLIRPSNVFDLFMHLCARVSLIIMSIAISIDIRERDNSGYPQSISPTTNILYIQESDFDIIWGFISSK